MGIGPNPQSPIPNPQFLLLMERGNEVLNIVKVKDGFFLGDEFTGGNFDVLVQFKISHIINAAGLEVNSAWESIGIKYLTLNWAENKNQNLFDPQDEIAVKILNFVDDALTTGEGLLVHSKRGCNRAVIVIMIYFAKKYRWTMEKISEFIRSKKEETNVPAYFLNQLMAFETRLSKRGEGPISNNWLDLELHHDEISDEAIIAYTYLNGLPRKEISARKKTSGKKLYWQDSQKTAVLAQTNISRDLANIKTVRPVNVHKTLRAKKGILRRRNGEIQRSVTPEFKPYVVEGRQIPVVNESYQENKDTYAAMKEKFNFNYGNTYGYEQYKPKIEEPKEKEVPLNVNNIVNNNITNFYINQPVEQKKKVEPKTNIKETKKDNNFFNSVSNPLGYSDDKVERELNPFLEKSKSEGKIRTQQIDLLKNNFVKNGPDTKYRVIDHSKEVPQVGREFKKSFGSRYAPNEQAFGTKV